MTCVSFQDFIPKIEDDLFVQSKTTGNIAVFYTIWSYEKGYGQKLIKESLLFIKENMSNVNKIITLSPKTIMASKFHLNNGAELLQENVSTINYIYKFN